MLKDDEVDRLERASRAACASASRQEVMESMYGRINPKPRGIGAISTVAGAGLQRVHVYHVLPSSRISSLSGRLIQMKPGPLGSEKWIWGRSS